MHNGEQELQDSVAEGSQTFMRGRPDTLMRSSFSLKALSFSAFRSNLVRGWIFFCRERRDKQGEKGSKGVKVY